MLNLHVLSAHCCKNNTCTGQYYNYVCFPGPVVSTIEIEVPQYMYVIDKYRYYKL